MLLDFLGLGLITLRVELELARFGPRYVAFVDGELVANCIVDY